MAFTNRPLARSKPSSVSSISPLLITGTANDRLRRVSPVPGRTGEGLLTEPTAATQQAAAMMQRRALLGGAMGAVTVAAGSAQSITAALAQSPIDHASLAACMATPPKAAVGHPIVQRP